MSRAAGAHAAQGNGTPEQVHLTWGDDPATSVVVSWASPGRALRPRVRIGQRVIIAKERACLNKATGKTAWNYHARVTGLRPGAIYVYAVTADNDANVSDPFTSTFRTGPAGRTAFRFTCSGDLAVPDQEGAGSVAGAVESFQPLFHLPNGGLCGAGPVPGRAFGNGSQLSAASRPWMPVPGSHDQAGTDSYLARYALPADGSPQQAGRWYSFRVAAAVFACMDTGADDDAQAQWLELTLSQARADPSVDWIIVQAHHSPWSSPAGRAQWLPLLDRYEVDLVLSGHGSGQEWSVPSLVLGHGGSGYAIAVIAVPAGGEDGGEDGDEAPLMASCYRASTPSDDVTEWERFTLPRSRRNSRRRAGRSR